jgi:N-acetylneuraminic acid mutarotase
MIREIIKFTLLMALSLACHTRVRADVGDVKLEATSSSGIGRWELGYLRQPRQFQSAIQLRHKALFASYTQCDIYDFVTDKWSRADFKTPRRYAMAVAGNSHAYFAGGETGRAGEGHYSGDVDVYNIAKGSWSLTKLSQPRQVAAVASVDGEVLFAGGINKAGHSGRVDVFQSATGRHYKYELSAARTNISALANGRIAVFAGGMAAQPSNIADIYHAGSKTWTTAQLSMARYGISVAAVGDLMLFAGGIAATDSSVLCDKVDIYNSADNTWKTIQLTEPKYGMATAVVNSKVYFIGGYLGNGRLSDRIEIYDIAAGEWGYASLEHPRAGMAVAQTHQRLMLAGGYIGTTAQCTERIEVLDLGTGEWSVAKLTRPRIGVAAAAYNGEVLFAGGSMVDRSQNIQPFFAEAEIWKQRGMENANMFATTGMHDAMLSYSKEDTSLLLDLTELQYTPVTVRLLDEYMDCKLKTDHLPVGPGFEQLNLSGVPYGNYWLVIEGSTKPIVRRIAYTADAEEYAIN